MPHYVGLDVSQKTTAICVVDAQGKRLWRGVCATDPGPISARISQHAGVDAKVGIETGSMTPWLVHGLRAAGLDVACLDARRVKAALQMQLNKTDENDAEGLAQIMRTGWYRAVHVKSRDAQRARALLGARAQLVGMTTRLSNMIRGVLKTFGLLPGAGRGLRFDRKVEALTPTADEPAQDVHRVGVQVGAQEGLRFLFAARVAHQHPADRHAHAGVMPERRAGGDVQALLGAAIPAVEADPLPARGRVCQPLLQAWLPSPFDPWPPTRAGLAGRGWRVEGRIKAQPGDQAQMTTRIT